MARRLLRHNRAYVSTALEEPHMSVYGKNHYSSGGGKYTSWFPVATASTEGHHNSGLVPDTQLCISVFDRPRFPRTLFEVRGDTMGY